MTTPQERAAKINKHIAKMSLRRCVECSTVYPEDEEWFLLRLKRLCSISCAVKYVKDNQKTYNPLNLNILSHEILPLWAVSDLEITWISPDGVKVNRSYCFYPGSLITEDMISVCPPPTSYSHQGEPA